MYLKEWDISLLRDEEAYVKKRYGAVARTLADSEMLRTPRAQAAKMIGLGGRQMQRIVKRFLEEGIRGLRLRSNRPHTMPDRTPERIELMAVEVRKATGLGPGQIVKIINKGLAGDGADYGIADTTRYDALARNGLVEAERRLAKGYRSFEWSRPDELVQADPTSFDGCPLLTMEDDRSRRGWATRPQDQEDDAAVESMNELHPDKYEDPLTDNGSRFSRKSSTMRTYREWNITGKHIWTSVRHPQTMGKLSAFQKGMERFLRHGLGRSRDGAAIDECMRTYLDWYNHGKVVSTTGCTPERGYSGQEDDDGWYDRLSASLKLQAVLPLSCTDGG